MITILLYSYTLQSSTSTTVNVYCDDFCLSAQFSKMSVSSTYISGKKVGTCYLANPDVEPQEPTVIQIKPKGNKQIEELKQLIEDTKTEIKDNEKKKKTPQPTFTQLQESADDLIYNIDDLKAQIDFIIRYDTKLGEQRKMFVRILQEGKEKEKDIPESN